MPAGECLAGAGLPPVMDSSTEVTAGQEIAVVRNLLARFGDAPGLGAEAGSRYRVMLDGPWGLALLASRTVRDAVEVVMRHAAADFAFGPLSFAEIAGEGVLRFDDHELPEDVRIFVTARTMTGLQVIYRSVFGLEPAYGANGNELVFAAAPDVPLPQVNEWARSTCEQMCRDLLARRHARSGVAGAVRDLLVRNPGVIPDQSAVAAELFVSARTLSRRLNEEGTSFRALLDEVRQALAEELLDHTGMTTEQVAARLGYAEAASFIRAFRRWRGCPPQEYRARGVRARVPEMV
ncbi:helix-turn-helix domain-containing protein [Nocardia terrae]|nr:AraC family transcriptional regulator [Nocardia terrae]